MSAILRYSPTVQDVSVTDAHGMTLVSTDPDTLNQQATYRMSLEKVREGSILYQARQVFGRPAGSRNCPAAGSERDAVFGGACRGSIYVSADSYEPWLKKAMMFALVAALLAMAAAALLANVALQPIEQISRQLEHLTLSG